jgi:hypothetical protein
VIRHFFGRNWWDIFKVVKVIHFDKNDTFFFVTRRIKTTKDEKKKNENYSLKNKVPAASLHRISMRPSGGDAWIMRSGSEEAPSLARKSLQLFPSLRVWQRAVGVG